MIIMKANCEPLRALPPGTPVVALDAAGEPVAIGTALSEDPAARPSDLSRFTALALGHSKQVGDYANVLSTSLKIGAEYLPDHAAPLGQTATVVSFLATGVSLANEIDTGDARQITVAAFKFGSSALAVIDEVLLPGIPALHVSAQACKLASVAVAAAPAPAAASKDRI